MARSIHTTRRDLAELHHARFSDPELRARELDRARAALSRKRRIKDQVDGERRRIDVARGSVDPAGIPIDVRDTAHHVHHAATPQDLVEVMRRLPAGVVDGISAITLSLGREHPDYELLEDGDPDPFTGRRGVEIMTGVYCGQILGFYRSRASDITLCAYVCAPSLPEARVVRFYLKLRALATFVHEVGHHHDRTARVARGRWLGDDRDRAEIYAERAEHQWVQEVVVPFLEEAYGDEMDHLRAWLLRHGGVAVPLSALVGDPRITEHGGMSWSSVFGFHVAFETLLADVIAGRDPLSTRVELANQVHYDGEYAIARTILAGVLAEDPDHLEALTLEADIDVHEGACERAETIVRRVLSRDPRSADAWVVLVDALHDQGRCGAVVDAVADAVAQEAPITSRIGAMLGRRAHAFLELGDDAALAADLCGLALGRLSDRENARSLRALWYLRRDALEEALALASVPREGGLAPGPVIRAVRFEAAHRLGRPDDAGHMTSIYLERLRRVGFAAWADRLARELAAYIVGSGET